MRFVLTEPSTRDSAPRLDRSLQAICAKAAAEQRDTRYSNVQDLSLDVSRYLDGLPVSARRENILEKSQRFYRRYRFFILLMLAYLVMRILLLLILKR